MAKNVKKISDKLAKVNDNLTVNMYDNGFMVEIGGRDHREEWATAKILVPTLDDLMALIKEASEMERD